MIQCVSCSREIPPDSRLCPYCGDSVELDVLDETVTRRSDARVAPSLQEPPGSSSGSIDQARLEWEQIHQKKAATDGMVVPADTPTISVSRDIMQDGQAAVLKLVVHCGFAKTNSEVRRLIAENGIKLNGEVLADPTSTVAIKTGDILQRGKRKFVRLQID